jgi:hypothetical protein
MSDTPDDDIGPDPIDAAYAQAETLLADDAARAARRARVLAAVAAAPAPPEVAPVARLPSRRDGGWRRGGWLAAACVAGLCLFVGIRLYRPIVPEPTAPASAPSSGVPVSITLPPPAKPPAPPNGAETVSAPHVPVTVTAKTAPAPEETDALAAPRDAAPMNVPAAPPLNVAPTYQRPAPLIAPPAEQPAPPPPPQATTEITVTAEKRESSAAMKARGYAADAATADERQASRASGALGGAAPASPVVAAPGQFRAAGIAKPDPGASLRAAAAAGRTADVQALLDEGVPVDAADANGDTALMKSVQADHPAAAAALRRHGANPDRKNHAGESARDMAAGKRDAALGEAIGTAP